MQGQMDMRKFLSIFLKEREREKTFSIETFSLRISLIRKIYERVKNEREKKDEFLCIESNLFFFLALAR
jgi:hypothetical protein